MANFDPNSFVTDLVEPSAPGPSTFRPASTVVQSAHMSVSLKSLASAARAHPPKPFVSIPANRFAVLGNTVLDPVEDYPVDQLAADSPDA